MSVSYKVIGRHIQEARKQAKLTQRAVAEKLNMPEKTRSCCSVFRNRIWLLGKEPQAHAARMQRHCTDGQRIKYT